jgi:hypothetical protein
VVAPQHIGANAPAQGIFFSPKAGWREHRTGIGLTPT